VTADRLALLSLHQRDDALDARERLAAVAQAAPPSDRLVALLTCHRVELYATVPAGSDPRAAVATLLAADPAAVAATTVRTGRDAALHLFRVALGLDSQIVGEQQIAGQVRRLYGSARERGIDPVLASLLQRALHLARSVRAATPLGTVRRSVGSLAVDEALRHVPDPLRSRALVIGAGEMGKLAARALAQRVGALVIANRDAAKAAELAAPLGARAASLTDLPRALAESDVVISAADTRGEVLTLAVLAERVKARPLAVVDIAVPRSVAAEARALPGLSYRDVDDLAGGSASVDAEVVALAERRCEDAASAFEAWLAARERTVTVRALRERADAIRQRQLARALRHLGHLPERDREVVAALASSLTHALLHEPTVRARDEIEGERAARVLFGIGS
jgi:glutamyl-tRNA reductase